MTTMDERYTDIEPFSESATTRLLADVMAEPEPCRGGCGNYDCCGGHDCDGGMIHSDSPADLADLDASVKSINACSCTHRPEDYGLTRREWHRSAVLGLAENLVTDLERGWEIEAWRLAHLRFHLVSR